MISCNHDKTNKLSNEALVDYDADSVFYKIDVKDDEVKEEFLVIRELFVRDSLFGMYNYDNAQRAFKYAKQNNYNPYLLYNVSIKENGHEYKVFSRLLFGVDGITYPILSQGFFSGIDVVSKKNYEHDGPTYLKIKEVSNFNLNCRCININLYKGNWEVFSKESIKYEHYKDRGLYCIDTVQSNSLINVIQFNRLFDYEGRFDCR